tara:strand:+ start:1008 stop:1337 length:330 start_codon:yes stop_codon:yes gene_type:complete
MKKSIKYIIKLFFVIILPVVISLCTLILLSGETPIKGTFPITVIFATLLGVWINAYLYLVMMPKTKLIPKVNVSFVPLIGFAIGYDRDGIIPAIVVFIPFLMVEFQLKK